MLHAFWSRGAGLRVWGERSGLPTAAPAPRGRPPRVPPPRPHPFACPADELHMALGGDVADAAECVVLLPSAGRGPLPSPGLPYDPPPAAPASIALAPWRVPACTLPPEAALDLLLDLDSARGAEVVTGASLVFLTEVAKFALERAAAGAVLPALERRGDAHFAVWRPVLADPHDTERLARLERSMPAVCRAGLGAQTIAPPADGWGAFGVAAPSAILESAMQALTDACVRQALADGVPFARGHGRPRRRPSAGEAWIEALAGADGRVAGSAAPLDRLAGRLREWAAAAAPDASAAFRTCFRLAALEDRAADDDGGASGAAGVPTAGRTDDPAARPGASLAAEPPAAWRLDFLLQAMDDPSLLVPAETVWAGRGRALAQLKRRLEDPQERLLAGLGRALRVFPALEPALRTACPTGLTLETDGAYRFLREAAPLLEQGGFGVLVPPWWNKPAARLSARLHAAPQSSTGSGLLGLDGICRYEWRLALGGETLTAEEFRALARLKQPLVRVRGQWVELRPEDVEAASRLFEAGGAAGEITALDALRIAAGAQPAPAGLPVAEVEADGWLRELLGADARVQPVGTPPGLRGTLRPYQERGLGWLAFLDGLGLGACLADDMGLGKTVQLLALLLHERAAAGSAQDRGSPERSGPRPLPTLLVCPMSVVGNWQHEAERFAPSLRLHVHHGTERLGGEAFREATRDCDLVITTYALAARDREVLAAVPWGRIVLDEAQNIKNSAARQTQAIRSLRAPRRIALTGTPVENRLAELWSIMEFLNPGLLGSSREFKERFANPIERFRDEECAERLKRLTGPFILRRRKADRAIIRDLPEKLEMKVYCNLTREQASLYQAVVDDMLQRIEESEGIERKGLILSTMLKLKQLCNHPAQLLQDRSALDGRSGKLALLEETLEEAIAVGDRVLVFTQFAEMGRMLHEHLRDRLGREPLFLHGGTPRKARDAMVARFQAEDGPPVFVLSLKAGGTGLNLTAANQVIHFDRWWNPAVEDQATDRAFRIGQRRDVQVRKLICAGTLEERIDAMIEQKKELAERIVGGGESWVTELSTADLRELLRLSVDAVAE